MIRLIRSRWLLWCLLLASWVVVPAAMAGKFTRVVIDPGHGGYDNGGMIGVLYEKHLALDVSFRLKEYLAKKGVKSVMTRSRDNFLPLEDRSAIANKIKGSIFVSIHFNWVSYGGPSGTETFYFSPTSAPLATAVQTSIATALGTPNRGVKFARYKVIRSATVPAALVEGGFISTAKERSKILDPRYRQRLAEAIGNGILQYRRQ
ncbi:MAG: N-acetylmuramoyl-L-alanine amidase [Verrucomicrobia bacterium]|jgi:N-acetylmuramoyl-L-alanine amidase|nr:MAG: N-acetylmuramoyl-L-alanine amidase [Verrucomicrobiota bacterium]